MSNYAVTNPATGEVVREYDTATDADIRMLWLQRKMHT